MIILVQNFTQKDIIFHMNFVINRRRIAAMAKQPTPSKASFDSLAEKRSLNFNTTAEVDSFENVINNPVNIWIFNWLPTC